MLIDRQRMSRQGQYKTLVGGFVGEIIFIIFISFVFSKL